jgi:hypothetical protein
LYNDLQEVRCGDITEGNGDSVPSTVTPRTLHRELGRDCSLLNEVESDDESNTSRAELVAWIKGLQDLVATMEYHKNELQRGGDIKELKASAELATSKILGCAQKQCHSRDAQTCRKINALVVDKIFSLKKFVTCQRDLDDYNVQNSLGMVVMDRMKVEEPDRLQFWNAYKEIVADAIANWHTTITNDLKKVLVMSSKYRLNDMVDR